MSGVETETYQVELVKRACRGDKSAFHEIVGLYRKKVYYIAFDICKDKHEAEDISQEVFIKVFRFIDNFKFNSKFSSWIYQIAVNTSLDNVRKHKDRQVYMESSEMESVNYTPAVKSEEQKTPEKLTLEELLQQKIRQEVDGLSKQEHSAFVLRYYNGFKNSEIAEVMELSINTVKTLLFRAKKKMQNSLAPLKEEYLAVKRTEL